MKKNWFYKNRYVFCSFFIPIILFLFYVLVSHVSSEDLLISDAREQYLGFHYYLKSVFEGDESIFFSFSKGMGESMLGTFYYYLSSPLNLIYFFVPNTSISIVFNLLQFIKLGLAGMTMHLFLRQIFQKDNIITIIFSITYAISGYTISYHFNTMWLDILYLTPLVLIGCNKILNGKISIFYIFFLFLAIISNFYLAYMLCIFLFLYVLYRLFLDRSKNKIKIIMNFILCSMCAVLLSSFVLLPVANELTHIYRSLDLKTNLNTIERIFNDFAWLMESFSITLPEKEIAYWRPNMYFTILNFILLINYFFHRKIALHEKKVTLFFILVFLISYIVPSINYIWHGFSSPAVLNYRYSFFVTLFLITITYRSFETYEKKNFKEIIILFILTFFTPFLFTILLHKNISYEIIMLNIFFAIAYILLLNIVKEYQSIFYKCGLLLCVIIELFLYMKFHMITQKNIINPATIYDGKYPICETLKPKEGFYRIESSISSANENYICQFSKIGEFNSMNHNKKYEFFKKSGFNAQITYLDLYYEYSPLISSLMGVRYLYFDRPYSNDDKYILRDNFTFDGKKFYRYENTNALSLGYAFDENHYQKVSGEDPFEYQNQFSKYLTGLEPYERAELQKIGSKTYRMKVTQDDPLYFYYDGRYDIDFWIDDVLIEVDENIAYTTNRKKGMLEIPNSYYGKTITIRFDENMDLKKLHLYYFNQDIYKKMIEILRKSPLEIKKIENRTLKGTIFANHDQTVFLSIPFDSNFDLYIDGKKEEIRSLYGTFVGFDISEGKHEVKLVYRVQPSFVIGVIISLITFIFLVGWAIYLKLKIFNKKA